MQGGPLLLFAAIHAEAALPDRPCPVRMVGNTADGVLVPHLVGARRGRANTLHNASLVSAARACCLFCLLLVDETHGIEETRRLGVVALHTCDDQLLARPTNRMMQLAIRN